MDEDHETVSFINWFSSICFVVAVVVYSGIVGLRSEKIGSILG